MSEKEPVDTQAARRRRLITLAALNLCLWIVLAGGVVLVVSRRVDLGVETFFREGPATLVAALRGGDRSTPISTEAATETAHPEPGVPTAVTRGPESSEPGSQATQEPVSSPTEAADSTPLPEPSVQLISSPLNLSDSALDWVMNVDAEMANSAAGRLVNIRYSEEALNREIVQFLQRFPFLPYGPVSVDLKRDAVVVKADVELYGVTASVEVGGRVGARDCRPWAEIDYVSISGMPTPGLFRDGIQQLLEDALAWYPPDHPLCLQWIIVDEDQVTVNASRR